MSVRAATHFIGPGADIAEVLELRVEGDQAIDLGTGIVGEIAVGEITDDTVPVAAIGLRRLCAHETRHDDGHRSRLNKPFHLKLRLLTGPARQRV